MSDLLDAITGEYKTELSRLGSSKALYALTEGEMDDDAVLAGAAAHGDAAAAVFGEWDGDLAAAAVDVAETLADAADAEAGERPALYDALADLDAEEQAGGVLGWTVVLDRIVGQLTGYFTGQADPQTASTFRSVRGDVEALQERALDAVEDEDRAAAAAGRVVEAAYDDYFETLESLGVNPKPVC